MGEQAGLELTSERRVPFELDFGDWLRRGTSDPVAHALVERAVTERSGGTGSFSVRGQQQSRTLTLQVWMGAWRRP